MTEEREDIIEFRKKKAFETFEEAKALAALEHWNGTANRLYYACFHIVNALLFENNHIAKTHSGVKTIFSK